MEKIALEEKDCCGACFTLIPCKEPLCPICFHPYHATCKGKDDYCRTCAITEGMFILLRNC